MEPDSRIYFDPPDRKPQPSPEGQTLVEKLVAAAAAEKEMAGGKIVTLKETLFEAPASGAYAFSGSKGGAKHYLQKVAKLVPIEIIGAYEAAILLVNGVKPEKSHIWIYWTLFLLGFLGTLWYVGWRIGKSFVKQRHLVVYGAAFLVWAYAISGERLFPPPYYQDAVASIVLIVVSIILSNIKLPAKQK